MRQADGEMASRRQKNRRAFDDSIDESRERPTREPQPEKLTRNALQEAALRYLDRQDGSVNQVRTILRRRVFRYGEEDTKEQYYCDIETLLERLIDSKILDDDRYSKGLAESQRRRGASLLKVRQKLQTRGLSNEHIEVAIESLGRHEELSEEASCAIYARKRRLKERYNLQDPKERNKALATLARQGYSFEVARTTLDL